jgi:hypothetical protein
MKITLTKKESEEHFHTALCGGSDLAQIGQFDFDENEYKASKKKWKKSHPKKTACLEDVWMQMLRDGRKIKFVDKSGYGMNRTLTIKKVHDRVAKTPIRHLMNSVNKDGDGTTSFVILQAVLFGKQVFG